MVEAHAQRRTWALCAAMGNTAVAADTNGFSCGAEQVKYLGRVAAATPERKVTPGGNTAIFSDPTAARSEVSSSYFRRLNKALTQWACEFGRAGGALLFSWARAPLARCAILARRGQPGASWRRPPTLQSATPWHAERAHKTVMHRVGSVPRNLTWSRDAAKAWTRHALAYTIAY